MSYILSVPFEALHSRGLRKGLSSIIIILCICIILLLTIVYLIPVLQDQTQLLMNKMPDLINMLPDGIKQKSMIDMITNAPLDNFFYIYISKTMMSIIAFLATMITCSLYTLTNWGEWTTSIQKSLPKCYHLQFVECTDSIFMSLKGWLHVQVTICFLTFIYHYILLFICGSNATLLLSTLISLSVFIPYIGPLLSQLLAIIYCICTIKGSMLYVVITGLIVWSLVSGKFISPILMKQQIGIHPLYFITLCMIYGSLFGAMGLVLAGPLTCVFHPLFLTLMKNWRYNLDELDE